MLYKVNTMLMNKLVVRLLGGFRALAALAMAFTLASCDGGVIFAPTPAQKLERGLSELTGAEVARKVTPVWADMLDHSEEIEQAGAAQDFDRLLKAYQSTHAALRRAVDETIQQLESAPDQSWRRKLLAEIAAGDDAEAKSKEYASGLFPDPSYGSEDPKFGSWLTRMAIERPREAGELARLAAEMQFDSLRLGIFFSAAIGSEAMKSVGEAYEGFRDGGRSAEK